MSLIYCPECGHEISSTAVACPSCGRPTSAVPREVPKIIVNREERPDRIPPWMIAPIVLIGALVLFGIIYLFLASGEDEDATRININANTRAAANRSQRRSDATTDTTSSTDIPPTSTINSSIPADTSAPSSTTSQTVPATGLTTTDSAEVVINAKVSAVNGRPQSVRNTRFYLLDEDIESILSDAGLSPVAGQSNLAASLAITMKDRQGENGEFYRKAMNALKEHVAHTGVTDATGQARLGRVTPDSYFLFGVAVEGDSFALWNSPVTVIPGENIMNLTPQPLTAYRTGTGVE